MKKEFLADYNDPIEQDIYFKYLSEPDILELLREEKKIKNSQMNTT